MLRRTRRGSSRSSAATSSRKSSSSTTNAALNSCPIHSTTAHPPTFNDTVMNFTRILAIALITLCTAAAWFILGGALTMRTQESSAQTCSEVSDVWGPALEQTHPSAFYLSPTGARGKVMVQPSKTKAEAKLTYE